jgi:LysM repeat protein
MSRKFLGIPAIFWLLGAAVLAYLYFKNKSGSSTGAGATSSAGSGTSSTGDIAFTPGTDTIQVTPNTTNSTTATDTSGSGTTTVGGSGSGDTTGGGVDVEPPGQNPQPTPPPKPPTKTGTTSVTYTSYIVKPGENLAGLAKRFGISVADLAHSNVYVEGEVPGNKKVGQTLGTGAGLKTGQRLKIPHYHTVRLWRTPFRAGVCG